VVEHLPSKSESLSSNPSTTKKRDENSVCQYTILSNRITINSFIN
jgi:hypothetical protein